MIRDNRPGGGADRTREQGFGSDRLTDEARDTAREIAHEAREQVEEVAQKISESGRELASEQKSRVAKVFGDVSLALREAGDRLHERGDEVLASYSRMLAKQADRACRYIEERRPTEILDDARRLVRRRPELFIGVMFVAGLGASRFLKASRRAASESRSGQESDISESQRAQYAASAATSTAGAGIVPESEQRGAGESQIHAEPGGRSTEVTGGPISESGSDIEMEGELPSAHFAEPRSTDIPEAMRREELDLDVDVDVGEPGPASRSPDRPDYKEEI